MTTFASRILPFALAASVVTSAQAGAQEDCISKLAPEWDKAAQVVAEKDTMFGKTTVYQLNTKSENKLALLYSHSPTAYFYSIATLHLDGGAPQINEVGMIDATANAVKAMMPYDQWAKGGKEKWAACFSTPAQQ